MARAWRVGRRLARARVATLRLLCWQVLLQQGMRCAGRLHNGCGVAFCGVLWSHVAAAGCGYVLGGGSDGVVVGEFGGGSAERGGGRLVSSAAGGPRHGIMC